MVKLMQIMPKIEQITSRENRRLVAARKVRDGRTDDLIFIEGKRLAAEAIRSKLEIVECFVAENFSDTELAKEICDTTYAVFELDTKLFESISDTVQSQGIILIAKRPVFDQNAFDLAVGSARLPVVLFLKEINNPSNLGAILRTAEAAGVTAVITSKSSADVFSPKALRAAMGAGFRLSIWQNADFYDVLKWAGEKGMQTVAADISGDRSYLELDWRKPSLLIFGSEAHGLSEAELGNVDTKIVIPMENAVESLNIAVSAGIVLFEAKRQLAA